MCITFFLNYRGGGQGVTSMSFYMDRELNGQPKQKLESSSLVRSHGPTRPGRHHGASVGYLPQKVLCHRSLGLESSVATRMESIG